MVNNGLKIHILKTVSYRISGTLSTVIVSYCLGGSMHWSSLLGLGELTVKPIIYFLHERIAFTANEVSSQPPPTPSSRTRA